MASMSRAFKRGTAVIRNMPVGLSVAAPSNAPIPPPIGLLVGSEPRSDLEPAVVDVVVDAENVPLPMTAVSCSATSAAFACFR